MGSRRGICNLCRVRKTRLQPGFDEDVASYLASSSVPPQALTNSICLNCKHICSSVQASGGTRRLERFLKRNSLPSVQHFDVCAVSITTTTSNNPHTPIQPSPPQHSAPPRSPAEPDSIERVAQNVVRRQDLDTPTGTLLRSLKRVDSSEKKRSAAAAQLSGAEAPNVVGPSKRKAYEFPDQPRVNAEGKLEATNPRRAIDFSPLSGFPDSQSLPPQPSAGQQRIETEIRPIESRGHELPGGFYQVTDPTDAEEQNFETILSENSIPSFISMRSSHILALLKGRDCPSPGCDARNSIFPISRGTVMEGRATVLSCKCATCNEEFRLGRSSENMVDSTNARSPFVQNVIASLAVLVRGNSLTMLNTHQALAGMGTGVSDKTTYNYLKDCGLKERMEKLVEIEVGDCRDLSMDAYLRKLDDIAEARGITREMVIAEKNHLYTEVFDGAWGHGRNASVGYATAIHHTDRRLPGRITDFPIIAAGVVQKSRAAPSSIANIAENANTDVPEFYTQAISGEQVDEARLYAFIGDHADGPSNTMEHRILKNIMPPVLAAALDRGILMRYTGDGDLSNGAQMMAEPSIVEIGLDFRHAQSSFKKRMLGKYGGVGKVSKKLSELIARLRAHFAWCYYSGLDSKWSENEFDRYMDHWCDMHENCPSLALCHQSGRGLAYRVPSEFSLHSMTPADRQNLRNNIKASLKRESFQKILIEEQTGVCESFNSHSLYHGASNGKFNNDHVNAKTRRYNSVLNWNRGFEWTFRKMVAFIFGEREVLSEVDWANIRRLDEKVEEDRLCQSKREAKVKANRRLHVELLKNRLQPYEINIITEHIPYGVYIRQICDAATPTRLHYLHAAYALRDGQRDSYLASKKCKKCGLYAGLDTMGGLCKLSKVRWRLFRRSMGSNFRFKSDGVPLLQVGSQDS